MQQFWSGEPIGKATTRVSHFRSHPLRPPGAHPRCCVETRRVRCLQPCASVPLRIRRAPPEIGKRMSDADVPPAGRPAHDPGPCGSAGTSARREEFNEEKQ